MPSRCVGAAAAGLACALAFEPLAWAWLAPIGVAGMVLAVRDLSVRRAVLVAAVFAAAFFYPLIWWMRVVGIDAWILLAGIQTAWLALVGPLVARVQRWPGGPLWVAAAWLASEVARSSQPFGGFPWGRLGFATADTPLAEALPYVGVHGAGFLAALLGATLAAAVVRLRAPTDGTSRVRRGARALAPAGVVALLVALPVLLPWRDVVGLDDPGADHAAGTLRVAAVQGNVPGRGDDVLVDVEQLTRNHVDLTVDLAERVETGEVAPPDLVVWPENSTAVDPFRDATVGAGIERAVAAIDRPVLVGAIVDAQDPGQVLNQGIVWEPGTGPSDRYTKWHPVPFGEYIPLRSGPLTAWVGRLDLVARDMVAGTRETPLEVAGTLVADAICFDVGYDDGLYAQVRRGAELAVVQTSNAMFVFTDQIDQQFAMSRLRALETGKHVVVTAINGVSGVIAPDGTVTASAAPRTAEVLLADVALNDATTPAVHLAPWLGRAAVWLSAAAALLLVVGRVRRRRSRLVDHGAPPAAPTRAHEPALQG
nr:apolipoprotein N-acyltransferase [Nocardioides perillae]